MSIETFKLKSSTRTVDDVVYDAEKLLKQRWGKVPRASVKDSPLPVYTNGQSVKAFASELEVKRHLKPATVFNYPDML